MAVSSTSEFSLKASEIILRAYRKINRVGATDTLSSELASEGQEELNLMLKDWMKYPSLWRRTRGRLVLKAPTITGITQADPAVVTATAHGLSNGDLVAIRSPGGMTELNGQTSTIANVAANTLELEQIDSSAYTAYTSGGTVAVLGYNLDDTDPHEVTEARFRQMTGGLARDIPMFWYEWEEYWELPVKASAGPPTNFHFNPRRAASPGTDPDHGILYIWPVIQTISTVPETIEYTYRRRYRDVDDSNDYLDVIQQAQDTVMHNLAKRFLPGSGMAGSDKGLFIIREAERLLEEHLDEDRDATVRFMPDYRYA